MNKKKYYVYKHTNLINNKVYIGQTCQKPENRWGNGINSYKNNSHFISSIQKYGWDNFAHEILLSNLTEEEARYWEDYYIEYYKARDPQYGYNILKGGLKSPFQSLWENEEFRSKMSKQQSEIMKERLKDPKTREFLSEISIQNWNSHPERRIEYSKRLHEILLEKWKDPEYREKQSKRMKDMWKDEKYRDKLIAQTKLNAKKNWENPDFRKKICKAVINIETGLVFESAAAAERWCNLSRGGVTRAVRKQTQGGRHPDTNIPLHWRYANENEGGDDKVEVQ